MPDTDANFIFPFRGRNKSGIYEQNLLWKSGSVYVMDNHRAALWCWLQELDLNQPHSLFHIDQHNDCLQSKLCEWVKNLPSWSSSVHHYLDHSYNAEDGEALVIRSDNYLSIYLHEFGRNLSACCFATHSCGDPPNHDAVIEVACSDLPSELNCRLNDSAAPWIVNVDLDYFFGGSDEDPRIIVSDDFLCKTFLCLRQGMEAGAVAVTTICLTPDSPYTPGWDESERLATKILKILGIDFQLPR